MSESSLTTKPLDKFQTGSRGSDTIDSFYEIPYLTKYLRASCKTHITPWG